MYSVALVLLGAGKSSRFKESLQAPKKQWLRIDELPLWLVVAKNIATYYNFNEMIIVGSDDELFYMQKFLDSYSLNFTLIGGGSTRQESLQNAISTIKSEYILVSDIARSNIPKNIFNEILQNIGKHDCVVPYLPINDTAQYNNKYLKREDIKLIQTPQLSKTSKLKEAIKLGLYTDESSAIQANNGEILYIKGDKQSHKITTIEDIHKLTLEPPSKKILVGFGSDIHALREGNEIILGGIKIPCEFEIIAHSDGDIVLHAVSDAILGAIGAGDIGEWFSDTDESYKDADSAILLTKIVEFSINVGYKIRQADIVIFAQKPKLSQHKRDMEKNIANLLNVPLTHINIKATTTEKLGFIGRAEGILVQCNVVLEYFDWKNHLGGIYEDSDNRK
ncbi:MULTISPECIES: bifunctional 2-C-methyl-D-erythritol 4-phosphate cytidylyltransferase/2-C-methyl-D-erythritol 2,4-cyclodiphosphate synthase [Helicobacter]|uniref:Bifunctional enzyme IspD/IspF n=1 Tax=Helicobacter ibis TaxID=2962633 RepID=A0ABT4VCW3_9HELI|nr:MULTISPECIES: bifunctional 2-C-methyl-D-erythritol 4-phosphate cytidylyltransferase/2-C-methyl-D-erythritol 2,4-cyclodiphosphate synthase [Helicobacter]MDA3966690.1 bifunctional 2-C-methyl-D-erythritol 4-phosphate cytidylyltransferase/2-C-methyl-D-erythritol 2,4-cyclodiphosphate synthase [Helicobacter sp. WB40]MDA3968542.1 bifunctional 2-C-methyl-D-erythritol 4-phosphate cytidylyltransferase/2-C-methyl-D-erythritol 2,4-cyclodiphosphate synthase [Helicobacter ibis]